MQSKRSLDPDDRTLYGANLQPPAGYVFDAGVATTFSMDFETVLAIPVSLALFTAENRDEILAHPLALLEGAERISGRLVIFTDSGHIQAHQRPYSRLCALLERIVVEVAAPKDGAFHPKVWAIRYKPANPEEPVRLRLLILSRNLTRDRSWDIALTLDGVVSNRTHAINKPLVEFITRLPDLRTADLPDGTRDLVTAMADDVRRTNWEVPEPFQSVGFAVNGLGGKPWRPDPCSRLGVISPFCDADALSMLAALDSSGKPIFVGRSDEIALLPQTLLSDFGAVSVLDEMAATEDGEEVDSASLHGLHAKAFVSESGWDTTVTIGSGNATRPALLSGANVEVFATLTGKRSKVGSVDEIFGERGFGRITRPFQPNELSAPDAAQRAAEARLEGARREICRSGLRLKCDRERQDDGSNLWRVTLNAPNSLSLIGLGTLKVWPITRGEAHGRTAVDALRRGEPVDLGAMPVVDLTRFIAFELTDSAQEISLLFSTGFPIDGLPPERHAAILRWVIDSKDAFFRYLRLLLSEFGDPFGAALAAQEGNAFGTWRAGVDDAPLLEEMVRAFCRGGDQLKAIERLVIRLESASDDVPDPVPEEFRTLWEAFRSAMNAREGENVH